MMRKSIDKDILITLVNGVCSSLDSFSAYDVTKILREQMPLREVEHDKVKDAVLIYVEANKLSTIDTGTYRIFTKQFAGVKPATNSIKVVFDGREPSDVAPDVAVKAKSSCCKDTGSVTVGSIDSAKRMMQSFGSQNKATMSLLSAPVQKLSSPKLTRRYNLQSEGRLILNRDVLGQSITTVNINGQSRTVVAGRRFRTGLSCQMVDVKVYDNKIEITPV